MELEQNSTSSNLLLWSYPTDLIIEEETCILSIVLFLGNGIAKFIIIWTNSSVSRDLPKNNLKNFLEKEILTTSPPRFGRILKHIGISCVNLVSNTPCDG